MSKVTRLDYCQFLWVSQTNYTLTYFADHQPGFSHDAVKRYLEQDKLTARMVWEQVRGQLVRSANGYLAFDDTVLDHNSAFKIELVQRSQRGNNNAYCQDNELSWFNWDDLERHAEILQFTRALILLTQSLECFSEERFWLHSDTTRITWHGTQLYQPDWSEQSRSIAFTLDYRGGRAHIMFNAFWDALTFELPHTRWRRIVDTGLAAPDDFCSPTAAPMVETPDYTLIARSSALFLGD